MVIEYVDFVGVECLVFVIGGEIVFIFDYLELVKFGSCKFIEEVMIGEDKFIYFFGVVFGEVCIIVLCGVI